jgi:hypothetical protein
MMKKSMIIAALVFVVTAATAAADPSAALVHWAENVKPTAASHLPPAISTAVHDWFTSVPETGTHGTWGLGIGGTFFGTGDAGSTWVYDSVRHIAADTFYGYEAGSSIFYSGAPPSAIDPFKCGVATCGHIAVVVFRDGRAVYISLAHGLL